MSLFALTRERADEAVRKIRSAPGPPPGRRASPRRGLPKLSSGYNRAGWESTVGGPLFGDFACDTGSADVEIQHRLEITRGRSRRLARTNPYAARYFALFLSNVMGDDGIQLKPRVRMRDGRPDELANRRLLEEWTGWGGLGCTVDGDMTWREVEALAAISWQRDGEALIRLVPGRQFNRWGFAVELIEADRLDLNWSTRLANGNEVRMGVEFARGTRRVVAYWILTTHPGDPSFVHSTNSRFRQRVPAEQIVHLFTRDRIGQSRGMPRLAPAMARLQMLGGYEEAELVASRAASSKMGIIYTESGAEYHGDDDFDDDGAGEGREILSTFEPGTWEELGEGQKAQLLDPTHPTTQYPSARKGFLQGFASATPAGYNAIANDLEGVNFSSLRHANLQERDLWKREQRDFITQVSQRVYQAWLSTSLVSGALDPLLVQSESRYRSVQWAGKRWDWIDPLKEAQANQASIPHFGKTVTEIATERGRTVRDIAEEVAEERSIFAELGLDHPLDRAPDGAAPAGDPPTDAEEAAEDARAELRRLQLVREQA